MQTLAPDLKSTVATSLAQAPIIAVVRHQDRAVATGQALAFMRHGLEMIEVTFTVPGATELVRELLALRPYRNGHGDDGGAGTRGGRRRKRVHRHSERQRRRRRNRP